jgi:hypothetical protein
MAVEKRLPRRPQTAEGAAMNFLLVSCKAMRLVFRRYVHANMMMTDEGVNTKYAGAKEECLELSPCGSDLTGLGRSSYICCSLKEAVQVT